MSEELEPWERRDNETDQAWEAFLVYRDMGPARSLAKAARSLGKSTPLLEDWSRRHEWRSRVVPFDRYTDRVAVQAYKVRATELMDQQLRLSKKLLTKLETRIDAMSDDDDPTMRWSTAYAAGTRAQREALNEIRPSDVREEAAEEGNVNVYDLMEAIIKHERGRKQG